jgi:peptide-methionine (S)-S-oxide reductase
MKRGPYYLVLSFLILFPFAFVEAETAKATFAGGCYWSMELAFDSVPGVISTTSGFAQLTSQQADSKAYLEAVEIVYDSNQTSYETLLEVFWKNVDPTDDGGQFCDRGPQYRTGIFYRDESQKTMAEKSETSVEDILKQKVVTLIVPAAGFHAAEESQQEFYKKSAQQYMRYKMGCGRNRRLREVWGSQSGDHK